MGLYQDIAGRNIAVDPVTEKIQLFDFELSARLGTTEVDKHRSDIDGVIFTIYEILTLDEHFRYAVHHDDQDVKAVENMVDWDVKVAVEGGDEGVKKIRSFLAEWAEGRRLKERNGPITASSPLNWPEIPPDTPIPFMSYPDSENESSLKGKIYPSGYRRANDAMHSGQHVVRWERPSMKSLLANNGN